MLSPTPRQLEILEVLTRRISAGQGAPTLEELATHFDIHVNAVRKHLISLAEKGLIELLPGRARGIRLASRRSRTSVFELPLVGRVAAGAPILSEGHIEARYSLDPALFRPRPDFLLRVEGDSMIEAGIEHGDLIAVQRTPVAEPGRIVVARLEGEITVKRLARDGEGWQLLPANPAYAPIRIGAQHVDFAIEGLYVGAIKRG
jgi:repressor LexA